MTALHPDDATLHRFVRGRLPAPDAGPVEEHVSGCDTCATRLGGLDADAGLEARLRAGEAAALGDQAVGPYRLVELLGEGGMGAVWRAEQTAPVARQVAVKLVRADRASPRAVQRFEAERQALARMDHPNVAKVLDAGADRGRPYFVMELVPGPPVTDYCAARGLGVPARLELFARVCRAVQHAHTKGLIHRDLKPGNVLVGEYDGAAVPKVIDFGVARAVEREPGDGLTTDALTVIGTPAYMAPEQAAPGNRDVDTRADVYALGVVLYELLAGSPPFAGGEPMSLLLRVIHEPPPEVRSLAPAVPRDLAAVTMKCLAKNPADRYQTAADLADDLDRARAGRPTRARPLSAREKARLWARRNPAVAGLLALTAAVTLAAAGSVAAAVRRAVDEAAAARAAEGASKQSESVAREAQGRAARSAEAAQREAARADAGRDAANRAAARLAFDQGVGLCEQGRADRGLPLLVDAVERAERAGDAGLARVARVNVRNWAASRLPAAWPPPALPRTEYLCAAYSPKGDYLAVGSQDGRVRVLDAASREVLAELPPPRQSLAFAVYDVLAVASSWPRSDTTDFWTVRAGTVAGSAAAAAEQNAADSWAGRLGRAVDRVADHFFGQQVNAVAFGPGGGRLCAGFGSGVVAEWDWRERPARPRVWVPPPHEGLTVTARDLASALESAARNALARGRSAPAVRLPQNPGWAASVYAVAYDPDGVVWFGGAARRLRRWDPAGRQPFREHAPPRGPVGGVHVSPGTLTAVLVGADRAVYTADRAGHVLAWDPDAGAAAGAWGLDSWVTDLAPAPAGPRSGPVAVTSTGRVHELRRDEPGGWRAVPYPGLTLATGKSVAADPDGRVLAVGDGDGNVTLLDTALGRPTTAPLRVGGTIRAVRFRPGPARELAVLSGDRVCVQPLPVAAAAGVTLPAPDPSPVRALAARPGAGGGVMVVTGGSGALFDVRDGKPVRVGTLPAARSTQCAAFPDGGTVLRGGIGGWDTVDLTAGPKVSLRFDCPDYVRVRSIAARPGGAREVFVNKETTVEVYPPNSRTPRPFAARVTLRPGELVSGLLFPADGRRVVVTHGERFDVLDADTGEPVRPTRETPVRGAAGAAGNPILCAALTADGARLVTGHPDTTAEVWDVASGRALLPRPLDHAGAVTGVAVRPDGAVILTGCRDGTARTWDAATGLPLGPKMRHESQVTAVAWGAGPATVLTGLADGTAAVWTLGTDPERGTAADLRARYGRPADAPPGGPD